MELGTHAGKFAFLGFLLIFVLIEAAWIIYRRQENYPWEDSAASFGVAFGKRLVDALTAGIAAWFMFWVYEHRFMTLEINSIWMLLIAFLAVEFFYYWHHRFAHEIRWLWATHGVHHTAPYMNLSVAGRLGWTGLISGSVLFFAPLALLGFHPVTIFILLAAGLFYQIWIHTELVGRLGPLEWILNTPSNHRVHHGSNPEYIDKNYGGVLIVFDHLFGTYAREQDDIGIVYGVIDPVTSRNPFAIAFYEWRRMARDVMSARRFRDAFWYMFGRLGWNPAGDKQPQQHGTMNEAA